uniref:Peptide/nickel transport system permease protein n=1 Tax=uncultured Chloroflexota bacterium TaxID=166587 RepID=H5SN43_9CHLR|nr:peptide/nickel transport system permease protein [uncultured Chloroflexota bacterium]
MLYIVRRLIYAFISLLGVSVSAFVILRVIPGDPALLMAGPTASQEDIQAMREYLGLTRSIPEQYALWIKTVVQGDFGTSIRFGQNVLDLVLERLPATLELALASVILATMVAMLIAILAIIGQDTPLERLSTFMGLVGFGIPSFLWGLIFIVLFGAIAQVLPVSGRLARDLTVERVTGFLLVDTLLAQNLTAFISVLKHLVLPASALALPLSAMLMRVLKSSLLEVMAEDYIFMDRVKGLSEWYIICVRALRNALIPTLTILGVQFTFLVSGSIVIEKIFSWPGLGLLALTGIQYRDFPLVQGLVMVYAVIIIINNLLVDLMYGYLNPKIRYA